MLVLKDILVDLLENGRYKEDRTKVGRYSVYGKQASFSLLENSFPAITLRKLPFKTAVKELLWFISGSSDNSVLVEQGINYWTPFAEPTTNSVGPMYGSQLRTNYTVHHVDGRQVITKRDLLLEAIYNLKHRPNASDNVYTLWNPSTKPDYSLDYATNVKAGKGALALCHGTVVQLHVVDLNKTELQLVNRSKEVIDKALDRLDLKGAVKARLAVEADIATIIKLLKAKQLDPNFYFHTKGLILQHYQRSQDVLALGFNIAQYALLTRLLARATGLVPLQYIHQWGDLHYYSNQLDSLKTLVTREPLAIKPKLLINTDNKDIDKYHHNDFSLVNYQHHPDLEFKLNS